MQIKYNVFIFLENETLLSAILEKVNEKYSGSFSGNKSIILSKPLLNLDDGDFSTIKSICDTNSAHLLFTWFSDDISQMGMDFYNFETKDTTSVERNLSTNPLGIISFLVSCGMEKFLEKVLLHASV